MKIRKLREIEYVTITEAPTNFSEYKNKSFEKVGGFFKDWLNGNARKLKVSNIEIGEVYTIVFLGDTNWNTIFGTIGVEYNIGFVGIAVAVGLGTGTVMKGFLMPLTPFTYEVGKGFDIEIYEDAIATTVVDVVRNRLYQRLYIQFGELRYSYMNTEIVGVPYINKKTKAEMDLILRSEILATEGVDRILEFNSTVKDRVYYLEFQVKTIEGEIIWLTIGQ